MHVEFFTDNIGRITHLIWRQNKKDYRMDKIK